MSILIDGYNLLHASGILPQGKGPHTFEHAREALLRFLAASLTDEERVRTTIVFDAREAPYNLPRTVDHEGMTIRFAPRDTDADTLIEELIRADTSPKRLTVVSSDHRIQNAARRRRAEAIDSDVWCGELNRRRHAQRGRDAGATKPEGPYPPSEVARWMAEFQIELADEASDDESSNKAIAPLDAPPKSTHQKPVANDPAAKRSGKSRRSRPRSSSKDLRDNWGNPFPPGYGEDIKEEDV